MFYPSISQCNADLFVRKISKPERLSKRMRSRQENNALDRFKLAGITVASAATDSVALSKHAPLGRHLHNALPEDTMDLAPLHGDLDRPRHLVAWNPRVAAPEN